MRLKIFLFIALILPACQGPAKHTDNLDGTVISSDEKRQTIIDEWRQKAGDFSPHSGSKSDLAAGDKPTSVKPELLNKQKKGVSVASKKKVRHHSKSHRPHKVRRDPLLVRGDFRGKDVAVGDELERLLTGTKLSLRFDYGADPNAIVRYMLHNSTPLDAVEVVAQSAGYGVILKGNELFITPRISRVYRLPVIDAGDVEISRSMATSSESGASGNASDTNIKTAFNHSPYKVIAASIRKRMGINIDASGSASTGDSTAIAATPLVSATGTTTSTDQNSTPYGDDVDFQSDVSVDEMARLVSIVGTRGQVRAAETYIASIWEEYSYIVHADVKIYEVSLKDNLHTGVNWTQVFSLISSATNPFNLDGTIGINLPATVPGGGPAPSVGVNINNGGIQKGSAMIQLLNQYGDVELVNQPRVDTTNHMPTRLANQDVTRFVKNIIPAQVQQNGTTQQGGTETDVVTTGTSVLFTPHVVGRHKIVAEIVPIVTILRGIDSIDTGQGTVQLPQTSLRNLKTTIAINDGQEKAIGGLITYKYGEEGDKVPFLGDIPFLGNLFKKRTKWKQRVEVVITVKPQIEKVEYGDFRVDSASLLHTYMSRRNHPISNDSIASNVGFF